jgi:SAM-dependent methyltransferase
MDISEIFREKKEIIEKYGEWTAHSILLAPNVWTVEGKENSSGRPGLYLRVAQDFLRTSLENVRVLDLGCLEGMYAFEFAKHGAEVVAIEGRLANIEKARFANRVLGFNKCQFIQDDVRNLDYEKFGRFEVVLCCGIFYHLDTPDVFILLEKMAEMCKCLLIMDTHVAVEKTTDLRLGNKVCVEYKGEKYSGRYYKEMIESPWAALSNNNSFWFDRKSLYRAIRAAGFRKVYEELEPHILSDNNDRLTLVLLK